MLSSDISLNFHIKSIVSLFILNDVILERNYNGLDLCYNFRLYFVILEPSLKMFPNYQKMFCGDRHVLMNFYQIRTTIDLWTSKQSTKKLNKSVMNPGDVCYFMNEEDVDPIVHQKVLVEAVSCKLKNAVAPEPIE